MKFRRNFSFKPLMIAKIKRGGGWVNAHAHADRAFTLNPETLDIYKNYSLEQKWDLVDKVKENASVDDYCFRFSRALEVMSQQDVRVLGSFIDIDPVCEDRALLGAKKARQMFRRTIKVMLANQTLKGVIEPKARYWFDFACEHVDIIGGLPKRDERDYGKGAQHMDVLLRAGRKNKKMIHVHVDQFNTIEDKETELLAKKTIKFGMEGRVVAIHCISLAAHPMKYRKRVYRLMKQAGMMVIACPVAWIDSCRKEVLQPFHNALTPVDEVVENDITVALGTDNICDYMVPFCDGDMWQELLLMSAGNRFTDLDEIVAIATKNGRKVLGI